MRPTTSEDYEDGASYSRKNFRSKTYEKANDPSENFSSEDGRIGRQLRLLSRETDEDVICKICQQLQACLKPVFLIQVLTFFFCRKHFCYKKTCVISDTT